jgi:hypothetical protein
MLFRRTAHDDGASSQPGIVATGEPDSEVLYIKTRNIHRDLGV